MTTPAAAAPIALDPATLDPIAPTINCCTRGVVNYCAVRTQLLDVQNAANVAYLTSAEAAVENLQVAGNAIIALGQTNPYYLPEGTGFLGSVKSVTATGPITLPTAGTFTKIGEPLELPTGQYLVTVKSKVSLPAAAAVEQLDIGYGLKDATDFLAKDAKEIATTVVNAATPEYTSTFFFQAKAPTTIVAFATCKATGIITASDTVLSALRLA